FSGFDLIGLTRRDFYRVFLCATRGGAAEEFLAGFFNRLWIDVSYEGKHHVDWFVVGFMKLLQVLAVNGLQLVYLRFEILFIECRIRSVQGSHQLVPAYLAGV